MSLVLPGWVAQNQEAELWESGETTAQKEVGGRWTQILRELDPRLSLVWLGERSPGLWGTVPGRWHVKRENDPPAPNVYFPIVGPNDEFMEPHSGIFEELQRRDLWRDPKRMEREEAQREKSAEKQRDLEREQGVDHIAQDFRAAKRVAGEDLKNKKWGRK